MSHTTHTNGTAARTPEEIEADIVRQRAALAETVDHLHHRLDVKSRARAKVAEVRHRATTDEGRPRPEVLAVAGVVLAAVVGLAVLKVRRAHS